MPTTREEFLDHLQSVVPGMHVVKKSESRLMRFLRKLLFFNKKFMSHFYTTLGNTVYVPDKAYEKEPWDEVSILAHEAMHIFDRNKSFWRRAWTGVGYIAPQIFAVFSLLSVLAVWFSNYWLLALVSLVFALPIPSPIRAWVEKRGYLMTLAVAYWEFGKHKKEYPGTDWVVKQFTSANYYWMWPFEKRLRRWFRREMKRIENKEFPCVVFENVLNFVEDQRGKKP